ncbi:MAG: aminopeptidase P family N-terminal domain-containing protein [Clostridium sp.]|nr:MAG: aminopeptidase P family N-terminal domain-containing protein [Clostridium sp.]
MFQKENKLLHYSYIRFFIKVNMYPIIFKGREYLSNFTGSAGTLVVTQNDARIWVHGRYFIQAEKNNYLKKYSFNENGSKGLSNNR